MSAADQQPIEGAVVGEAGQPIGSGTEQPIVAGAEPEIVGPLLACELHDPRWEACSVALLSGGRSNLTYEVRSDAGELILRRPPLGHILPTAHDMEREYRVLTALRGTAVPVPRTFLIAEPEAGLGVRFYVMERVIGHVCRDSMPPGYADQPAQRAAIGEALIDTLAALHTIEPGRVGLGDFGRPAGFMERQLRRWSEQWERSKRSEVPELERLRDDLVASLPAQGRAAIVHGDYRLDNTVLHPARAGEIVAVLDWEMSTLGDPLADLATTLSYWSEAGDPEVIVRARMFAPLTTAAGFPTRAALIERYARRTGFDLEAIGWYEAFAFFKLAVIFQGIAARAAGGAMLGAGFEGLEGHVERLVDAGRYHLARAGVRS
jgi:aminoglycoside phosphotransferase (APT) family kinase protein